MVMLRSASQGVVLTGYGRMSELGEQRRLSAPTTFVELQNAEM